jgi:hypothetical protein
MIRIFLAALFLIPSTLWGAPIKVQSGEHGSFTRLVVYLPESVTWNISSQPSEARMIIAEWEEGFDLSNVFKKIGTDRIKSLASTDSELIITFACDCSVVSNMLEKGFVQLDVFVADIPKPIQRPRSEVVEQVEIPESKTDEMEIWNLPRNEIEFGVLERLATETTQVAVDAFGQSLIEEIAKSATVERLNTDGDAGRTQRTEIQSFRSETDLIEILQNRARFSDSSDVFPTDRSNTSETSCENAGLLLVSKWAAAGAFSKQLSILRRALVSEEMKKVEIAKTDLAKFYLHFGLGPEAIAVLDSASVSDLNTLLNDFGQQLNSDFKISKSRLHSFQRCKGETGFWAVLASDLSFKVDDEKEKDLLSVFQSLPQHLKIISARKLVEIFRANNLDLAAEVVKNSLERQGPDGDQGGSSSSDEIEIENLSRRQLEAIVSENGVNSPMAMALLLEGNIEANTDTNPDELDLASAFAFQLQETDIAKRLGGAIILANFLNGNFHEASQSFYKFDAQSTEHGNYISNKSIQILISAGNIAQATEFVWKVVRNSDYREFEDETLAQLVEALLDAGQPHLLEELVSTLEIEMNDPIQMATVAQQLGNIPFATAILADPDIETNRDRSLSLLVDYSPTTAWTFRDELPSESVADLAWALGNWNEIIDDSFRGRIARRLISNDEQTVENDKPIGTARNILLTSVSDRSEIDNLLNGIDISLAPESAN